MFYFIRQSFIVAPELSELMGEYLLFFVPLPAILSSCSEY